MTPTGREIVRRARRILDDVREIEQVARWDHGLGGRLRIGVIPTVAPYLLPRRYRGGARAHLSLDLGVREAQTERLVEEVRRGLDADRRAASPGAPISRRARSSRNGFPRRQAPPARGLGVRKRRPVQRRWSRTAPPPRRRPPLTDQALAACAVDRARARMDLRAASLTTLPPGVRGVRPYACPSSRCGRNAAARHSASCASLSRAGPAPSPSSVAPSRSTTAGSARSLPSSPSPRRDRGGCDRGRGASRLDG